MTDAIYISFQNSINNPNFNLKEKFKLLEAFIAATDNGNFRELLPLIYSDRELSRMGSQRQVNLIVGVAFEKKIIEPETLTDFIMYSHYLYENNKMALEPATKAVEMIEENCKNKQNRDLVDWTRVQAYSMAGFTDDCIKKLPDGFYKDELNKLMDRLYPYY